MVDELVGNQLRIVLVQTDFLELLVVTGQAPAAGLDPDEIPRGGMDALRKGAVPEIADQGNAPLHVLVVGGGELQHAALPNVLGSAEGSQVIALASQAWH